MGFAGRQKFQPYRRWLASCVCLGSIVLLTACGFSMRGVTPLPFKTLYLGISDTTRFGAQIRRAVRAASPDTVLVADPKQADALLQVVHNARTITPASLNAQGRVSEYTLGVIFTFRLIDRSGRVLAPDTTLTVFRDMPYDDQLVQAKESQIETLYRSMQLSLIDRLVSRLAAHDVAVNARAASAQPANDNEAVSVNPAAAMPAPAPQMPPLLQQPSIDQGAGIFE